MSSRGLSWMMGIKLADDASRPLLQFSRAAAKVAAETTRNARATSEAMAKEARAARATATEKLRASEQAAAAAKKSSAEAVAAAQRAAAAGTKEARQAAADAARVAAAEQKAATAAMRSATAAERAADRKQRASIQAANAVQTAATKEVTAQKQIDAARKKSAATAQATSRVGGSALGAYAKSAMAFAGLGGLGAVTRSAYTFDKTMKEVGAVSQASDGQLRVLSRTARQLGLDVGTGATAAADAMVELSKAGLTTKEIGPALKGVLTLAQAGGMAAADASSAAADSMNAFGIAAKDTTKIADAMANAANLTTADVGDFALAISQGGSAAKLAGVSFNDTMLTLTELARIGVKGSDAGTSMKSAFLQLAKPTEQAAGEMKKYGLEFFSAEGKMKKVADIGGMLQQKLGGLTKQQQVATLQTIAGTDGFRTLAAMMGFTRAEAEKLGRQLTAEGSAVRMAADMQTPWERFRAAMEDIAITVGGPVLTELSKGAEAVSKFVRSADGQQTLKELGESIKGAAEQVTSLVKGVYAFGRENPGLVKLATTLVKIGLAAKAIKFAAAITGLSTLGGLAAKAGKGIGRMLGLSIGETAAENTRRQLRKDGALTGGLGGRMKSVGVVLGSWLGLPLGKTAADKAGDGLSKNGAITGRVGGRMASVGGVLGKALGVSMAVAAADELSKWIDNLKSQGDPQRKKAIDTVEDPLNTRKGVIPYVEKGWKWLTGNRGGGRILPLTGTAMMAFGAPAFAYGEGGVVPAIVSPGELIEYGGVSGIVPGARVAADTVPMLLPVGARVFTDHGQALMSMGASPEQALRDQMPHFRKGGEATRSGRKKPVRSARVGYTVFSDAPPGAFGALDNGYAELGTATKGGKGTGVGWIARALGLKGELAAQTPLTITINGKSHTLLKRDRGYGQGSDPNRSDPKYAVDVWKDSWSKFGLNANSKGTAVVALGTKAQVAANGTTGKSYSYTVNRRYGKSASRAGLLDDAYTTGYSGIETWGSRAAARRAGVPLGVAGIRDALDSQQGTYTRKVERSAPSSRSGSSGSSDKGIAGKGWLRPVASGSLSSGYGARKSPTSGASSNHDGVDIAVPTGTSVRAAKAGRVTVAGDNGGYGKYVRLAHANNVQTFYGHLSKIGVTRGQRVARGAQIALSGNTGTSTGPHLHFGAAKGGQSINPASLVSFRRGGLVGFASGGTAKKNGRDKDGNVTTGISGSAPKSPKRREIVRQARQVVEGLWPFARPYLPGAGTAMPPTKFGATRGVDGAFLGNLTDTDGKRKGRYTTLPWWALRELATGSKRGRAEMAETVVHEWAHHHQTPGLRARGSDVETEGGAQAWTRKFGNRIFAAAGAPYRVQSAASDYYMPHVRKVRARYGADWIARGQFVDNRVKYPQVKARRGGLIDRGFVRFGSGGKAQPKQSAVQRSLGAVRQSASQGNLGAFGLAIEQAAVERVQRLHSALLKEVRGSGDRRTIDRLRAALSQIQVDLAARGAENLTALARKQTKRAGLTSTNEHLRRRAGISDDSSAGIQSRMVEQFGYLTSQSPAELADANAAIKAARADMKRARRAKDPEGIAAAREQLNKAQDAKGEILAGQTEARTLMAELQRQLPQILGQERLASNALAGQYAQRSGSWAQQDAVMLDRKAELERQLQLAQGARDEAWQANVLNELAQVDESIKATGERAADRALATIDADATEASLTESKDDDIEVERRRRDTAQVELDKAREARRTASNDEDRARAEANVVKFGGIVQASTEAIKGLDSSMQELADRQQENTDLLKVFVENQQKLLNGSAASREALVDAIGAAAAGYIGQSVMRNSGAGGFSPGGWRP